MLPAYVPNPVAALLGGGSPIDGGRVCRDGRRLFGDGKTWRGFAAGVTAGIAIGLILLAVQDAPAVAFLPDLTVEVVALLSLGALLGDLVKSFFKRRLGRERGSPWLIADQYDLVAGAFILLLIFEFGWVAATLTVPILLWIIIITPLLHRGVNIIGYLAGIKDVPW